MRKVFLDDLPRMKGYKDGRIDWANSVLYKVNFIYDNIDGELEIVGYKKPHIDIKYKEKIYTITITNFKKPALGNILGVKTSDFKINIGEIIKDLERDFLIVDRKYIDKKHTDGCIRKKKYYKYICNKCGNVDWKEERKILSEKTQCNNCYTEPCVVEGINDIPTTAPWMVEYFQDGYYEAKKYTRGSNKMITFKCPDCGRVKEKSMHINDLYRRKSIGCSCSDGHSYGEKIIYSLLEQFGLNFKTEVKFDWCMYSTYNKPNKISTGFYDFVIEDYKLIIEVDGNFHITHNYMNGQTKEHSTYIDDMKTALAKDNGYNIIRIDCMFSELEEIKRNVLNSELNGIFDLSEIDWLKCEEFAFKSNKVKDVCDYWNNKQEYETTKDLSEIFKVDRNTITSYLKKGINLGWSNYSSKEELVKAGKSSAEKCNGFRGKKIEVVKDDKPLGTYTSIKILSEVSKRDFGLYFNTSSIGKVAQGKQKHHKGFTFKYVD